MSVSVPHSVCQAFFETANQSVFFLKIDFQSALRDIRELGLATKSNKLRTSIGSELFAMLVRDFLKSFYQIERTLSE